MRISYNEILHEMKDHEGEVLIKAMQPVAKTRTLSRRELKESSSKSRASEVQVSEAIILNI
jgi:type III secretory pathway component EscU